MMSPEHGSSLPTGEYEVFLSFRGPDVRQTFADSLYSCLVRSKIRTFRDEEELRRGETIGPSLIQAITESKIYIPILTQNYASSKWCFQELAKMVDCWKNGGGAKGKQHIILPVFYLIDPRDVRHPDSGSYKEAFEQHSLEHDPETILEWKDALQEVGKMKGWHVTHSDGHGAIIDKILAEVELHLRANYKLVTDELVGIDNHVDEVMKLLNLDSPNEKIVGIHGMGGLGKTTLAKAVYNKVSAQFERCCFLDNIRDMLSKTDGAIILQNKIISEILREDSYQARNASSGIRIIKERVCRHKLLIVLDDVDEEFCFDDILGELSNFSMDSRFLITTRDVKLDDKDMYWMHDHLRDLGRAIVREENNQNPCKRSRIWSNMDAIDMLKHKEGTDCVEALIVDMKGENLVLTNEEFKNLTRLRYLVVCNARLVGNFKDVLPNIRWLRMFDCESVPADLNLMKLVNLLLSGCSVTDGWKGWSELKVTPKLATLNIRGCTQLTELRGLGRLESLEELSMSGCKLIKELPNLSGLKNLRILDIRKCVQLKEVNGIEELESLQVFDADTRLRVWYMLKSVSRYGKQLVTRSVPGALFMNN
ncbi:Disease resistance protein L6 [Linum perenne]